VSAVSFSLSQRITMILPAWCFFPPRECRPRAVQAAMAADRQIRIELATPLFQNNFHVIQRRAAGADEIALLLDVGVKSISRSCRRNAAKILMMAFGAASLTACATSAGPEPWRTM